MPWAVKQAIAEQIVAQQADYVLAVKGNQVNLQEDMSLFFRLAQQNNFQKVTYTYDQTVNKDHGRVEVRHCWAVSGQDSLQFLRDADRWRGLRTLVMVTSQRQVDGQTSSETRYYITSLPNDATRILHAVRSHWGVENALHWVLDVVMAEDDSRIRKDHAPGERSRPQTLHPVPPQTGTNPQTRRSGQTPEGGDEPRLLAESPFCLMCGCPELLP